MTTLSTNKISGNFIDLNRWLSVYPNKSEQKHMFLVLTLEISTRAVTVNKPNPRAGVPTQIGWKAVDASRANGDTRSKPVLRGSEPSNKVWRGRERRGAGGVTYRWARATRSTCGPRKKKKKKIKGLVNSSSYCHASDTPGSLPLALTGRISCGTPARSGTVAGLRAMAGGRGGRVCFPCCCCSSRVGLSVRLCESVCVFVCVRVCARACVGRASSRFPLHQLSRPLRTVPPFHVELFRWWQVATRTLTPAFESLFK